MKRIFLTVMATLVGVFAVWYGFNPLVEKNAPKTKSMPLLASATFLDPTKPMINFSLTDTTGKPFTEASLLGQWTLMFFGYAQCPGICPKTLATISETWKALPQTQEHNPVRFVFVSLDPQNDTIQNLQTFLNRFDPNFIGLTGEENTIAKLSRHCSIYYWQDPDTKAGRRIDHSSTLMLIDPQGRIKALFSPPYQTEVLAKDLQTLLES